MRTIALAVKKLVEVDETINEGDISPFIETANALVEECCATATKGDGTPYYTDARLELIERWLSAHFYVMRDQAIASEKAGPVSANYQYDVGKMLQGSRFGQQAITLDTYGGLAALSKSMEEGQTGRPGVTWLGNS